MADSAAQRKAKLKYAKANYKEYRLRVNKKYDLDIIEHMENLPNKNEYLQRLVREDMNK